MSITVPAASDRSLTLPLRNASIAVIDEDKAMLSRRILSAFFRPAFKPAEQTDFSEIDPGMDSGRYTFVLDILSVRHEISVSNTLIYLDELYSSILRGTSRDEY